jgi:molybdopterin-guanine dinucleotide biosynthesis protein B
MSLPLFGVTGWKNSGKTTLMAKLIAEFSAQGLQVAAIKHAHHAFDVDHEGRDSWRFREAGAGQVIIASPLRWARMVELRGAPEPRLTDLLAEAKGADLILIEGYKTNPHPKIEVRRRDARRADPLAPSDSSILAIASDLSAPPTANSLPHFALDDVAGISNFIAAHLNLRVRVS